MFIPMCKSHEIWWKQKPVELQVRGFQEKNKEMKMELIVSEIHVEINI